MSWGTENILGAFNLAIKSDSNVCLPTLYKLNKWINFRKYHRHNKLHHCSVLCSPLFTLISTDNFFEKFCSVCANSLVGQRPFYHELNHDINKSKDPN